MRRGKEGRRSGGMRRGREGRRRGGMKRGREGLNNNVMYADCRAFARVTLIVTA